MELPGQGAASWAPGECGGASARHGERPSGGDQEPGRDGCAAGVAVAACSSPRGASGEAESAWAVRRRFALPLIAPGLLQGKSGAVVSPMLPIFVREDLHGSNGAVGLVAAAYSMASLVASPVCGVALRNVPYSVSACLALCVLVLTAAASYETQSVAVLFCVRLVGGAAMSTWNLSRKSYLAAEVPKAMAGRISSTLAGAQKTAIAVAAVLSGAIAQHVATRSIFLVQIAFTGTALMLLLSHEALSRARGRRRRALGAGGAGPAAPGRQARAPRSEAGLWTVGKEHWRDLLGAGLFCAVLQGARNTWGMVLPLQAHAVGIPKQSIGVTIAVQRTVEVVITFACGGQIMDKHGLRAGTIPGLLLLTAAFALLPLSSSTVTFLSAACVYGVGNGLLSGITLFFTSRLAPAHARTQFVGLFQMVLAVGGIALPPALGLVADAAGSLETATLAIAGVVLLAAAWLACVVRDPPAADAPSAQRLQAPGGAGAAGPAAGAPPGGAPARGGAEPDAAP